MGSLPLLLALGCIAIEAGDSGNPSGDSGDDSGRCAGYLAEDDFVDPWREAFCSWNVQCGTLAYGESMDRCFELTASTKDRCLDLCETGPVLEAMQAEAAEPDCDAGLPEDVAVPYCDELD